MKPEIRRYLDEHGDTYTTDALRQRLLDAGNSPEEVDAALREWQAEQSAPDLRADQRRAFGWWAFGLHAAVLGLAILWLLAADVLSFGFGQITLLILAIALLLGWVISTSIGWRLLPGLGPSVALIVPAVSALLIGGSCVALLGGLGGV
jgi:hypothetical protein